MNTIEKAKVLWFIPTHGDGRYLGTSLGGRAVDFAYLRQIAQAADALGYFGVLLPTGQELRGFLGRRLGPGAANRAVAFSRRRAAGPAIAGGRGPHDGDARPDFAGTSHDQRRHRRRSDREQRRRSFPRPTTIATSSRENFSRSTRLCLRGETVTCSGKHLQVEAGKLLFLPFQEPTAAALFRRLFGRRHRCRRATRRQVPHLGRAAAKRSPRKLRRSGRRRSRAAGNSRSAFDLHVIVRETAEEAWRAADKLISHLDDATIATAQKVFSRMDSVGQSRMARPAWRPSRQARSQPQSLGGRRPGARRRRDGPGRRSRRRSHSGCESIMAIGIDSFIHVGLSASRGSLSVRRAGDASAAARPRSDATPSSRSIWARSAKPSPTSLVRR